MLRWSVWVVEYPSADFTPREGDLLLLRITNPIHHGVVAADVADYLFREGETVHHSHEFAISTN